MGDVRINFGVTAFCDYLFSYLIDYRKYWLSN